MRKFQELCDAIAAQNAAREAEWKTLHQTSEPANSGNETPDSPSP
jgi:hypothetical protein